MRDVGQCEPRGRICSGDTLSHEFLQFGQQHFRVDRLRQKICGAEQQPFVHRKRVVASRKKDERNLTSFAAECVEQREAVHAGQHGFGNDQRGRLAANAFQRRATVGSDIGPVTLIAQTKGQQIPRAGISVDNENPAAICRSAARGVEYRLGCDRMDVAGDGKLAQCGFRLRNTRLGHHGESAGSLHDLQWRRRALRPISRRRREHDRKGRNESGDEFLEKGVMYVACFATRRRVILLRRSASCRQRRGNVIQRSDNACRSNVARRQAQCDGRFFRELQNANGSLTRSLARR